jgi:hypothetical protein
VLDGPPGTGKSQTIANIIAESLATGKTVLFVSEKAAARQVVKRRLDASNLGDFCLECHKANKKEVIAELGRCLDEHEDLITTFHDLDQEAVAGASKRIREKLLADAERPHIGMLAAPPSSEVGILLREVAKQKRHLALRQLFGRIPTLLPRLKPCLMTSPLTVSTFLDSPDLKFDLVIFDEASQVRPFDAIGAVYRGSQLIVAGDEKQLPPTSFFDRDGDDDEDEDDEDVAGRLSDFESILKVCCSIGMRRQRLRWHYRSRREPLIAFSNRKFYENELVTFPSVFDADGATAVQFQFVPDGRWCPGTQGGFNRAEARETALLVFRLLDQYPDDSLGVITFNTRQQLEVLGELARLRHDRPEMEEFFQEDRNDSCFVKNLETVQGDERHRIIISVGYARDEQGKFAMRFGPLNVEGGERRLNVAVTACFPSCSSIRVSRRTGRGCDLTFVPACPINGVSLTSDWHRPLVFNRSWSRS